MFADAIAKVRDSMFPILYTYQRDDGPVLGVSGTGFFVGDNGLFLTVDHIMNCAPPGATYFYYGELPDHICEPGVEIEHVASDRDRDLYLGRVARQSAPPVTLSGESTRPGDYVCLAGYPMAAFSLRREGGFAASIRQYWQPTFVIDATYAVIEGRGYEGYIVGDACFSGMSGGPVFDSDGNVRGMAVATLTRTIPDTDTSPTVVRNGIVIDAAVLKSFVERHRRGLAV